MDRLVKVWNVGRINYAKGIKLQNYLAAQHAVSGEQHNNIILCVEHPPVYTTGIRTKDYSEKEEKFLIEKGAEFFRTNRGGLITFHGPGQMVVYPILNLKYFKPSMRWYVDAIEKSIIHLCSQFGLKGETSPHTGVWIKDNKICAIGIHGSRFITTHGLALNCSTDLSWFDHIVPCGIEGKGVTSLSKELNRSVEIIEVFPKFLESFQNIFNCEYVDYPESEAKEVLNNLG